MNHKRKILKLALFGVSGSGKSTAAKLLIEKVKKWPDYKLIQVNVAEPLHQIQKFTYEQFGLANTGQDGKLLEFLAGHFEKHLGERCVREIERQVKFQRPNKNLVVLNSDCRNNAYMALKNAGFRFVRVYTSERIIRRRLAKRGDITEFNRKNLVNQIEQIREDHRIENSSSVRNLEAKVISLLNEFF